MDAIRDYRTSSAHLTGDDSHDLSTAAAVDPLFATPVWQHDLRLPHAACTRAVADWLTHAVTRTPRDLAAHVLRIHVLQDLGDAIGLADALADLWIALGNAGRQLKERMLHAVERDLPDGAAGYFTDSARPEDGDVPWGGCPALARGCAQRPVVVLRS